jgi:hypothetical protein
MTTPAASLVVPVRDEAGIIAPLAAEITKELNEIISGAEAV